MFWPKQNKKTKHHKNKNKKKLEPTGNAVLGIMTL